MKQRKTRWLVKYRENEAFIDSVYREAAIKMVIALWMRAGKISAVPPDNEITCKEARKRI